MGNRHPDLALPTHGLRQNRVEQKVRVVNGMPQDYDAGHGNSYLYCDVECADSFCGRKLLL